MKTLLVYLLAAYTAHNTEYVPTTPNYVHLFIYLFIRKWIQLQIIMIRA